MPKTDEQARKRIRRWTIVGVLLILTEIYVATYLFFKWLYS